MAYNAAKAHGGVQNPVWQSGANDQCIGIADEKLECRSRIFRRNHKAVAGFREDFSAGRMDWVGHENIASAAHRTVLFGRS